MDAMGKNTDAINNMETSNGEENSVFDKIKNSLLPNSSNTNNSIGTTTSNDVRIVNIDELAKTIAEKINGSLSIDVPDTQVQLLINGTGGNEWTITKY
jgi:hypothetical protein